MNLEALLTQDCETCAATRADEMTAHGVTSDIMAVPARDQIPYFSVLLAEVAQQTWCDMALVSLPNVSLSDYSS